VKFLIDMPLSPQLGAWLRQQGHHAVHARDSGLSAASDVAILQRARDEQRIAVAADLDFPRLLALTHATSPGLVLYRGGNYSEQEAIDRLQRALEIIPHEDFSHCIIIIEKTRIRRRRLPLA
jgi:predicted nuclease of predicted toxin-antitoxin system